MKALLTLSYNAIPRIVSGLKSHVLNVFGRVHKKSHMAAPRDVHASEADVPVLDVGVFHELLATLGNSSERVRTVYEKFQDSAATRIDELRREPTAIGAKTLHALKGSAGMVGASRLAALVARLHEATLETGTLSTRAIGEIDAELAKFHECLRGQLDRL